jgi:hypothetical protein
LPDGDSREFWKLLWWPTTNDFNSNELDHRCAGVRRGLGKGILQRLIRSRTMHETRRLRSNGWGLVRALRAPYQRRTAQRRKRFEEFEEFEEFEGFEGGRSRWKIDSPQKRADEALTRRTSAAAANESEEFEEFEEVGKKGTPGGVTKAAERGQRDHDHRQTASHDDRWDARNDPAWPVA